MAAEPSKTEIQTLFKRLRGIPTNKVREREARGVRRWWRRILSPLGPEGGREADVGCFLGVSSPGLDSGPLTIGSSPPPPRPASTVAPRIRVGPASRMVFSCALTVLGCTAPWASISASSGGVFLRLLCCFPAGAMGSSRESGCLNWTTWPGRGPVVARGREPPVWALCHTAGLCLPIG